MRSFPMPLSAKEEKEYLDRCREGDLLAREKLIEHNLRLVAYIAKKYSGATRDMDDLISIGTIGLIKGIDSFDASKNIRLATYVSRCIDNELLMMMRNCKKTEKDVYLYDPIGSDKEGNEINLMDIMEYQEEDITDRIVMEGNISKLKDVMTEVLSEREYNIICMRYGLGGGEEKTQKDIAEIYNISRSYVSRIEKNALQKLRKKYESM